MGDSRQKSAPKQGTQCPPIAPACQWISTTTGRIAFDGHTWMTAIHWAADPKAKRYTPTSSHGPRGMNATTLLIAQECANLKECRPGIAYLARKLRISERTVEYHLGMLREAGLLVYRTKGGRVAQGRDEASVYERTIPLAFDEAHGIRVVGEGVQRRPVGAADAARKALGKLARKAARKVRRPRRRTPVSGQGRCTLMEGGSTGTSSAGGSIPPSETKLASGTSSHPTPKKTNRGPQKLNKVGRRHQLARQLIDNVPWLSRASAPRIAWIARHCADAGWQWQEVQAAAEEQGPIDARDSRRPSGLLAYRLKGAHKLYASTKARHLMLTAWEDSRLRERIRHQGWDGPGAAAAEQYTDTAAAAMDTIQAARQTQAVSAADLAGATEHPEGDTNIDALTRAEVLEHRQYAAQDPTYVRNLLEALGNRDARRLLTNRLVDQALVLLRLTTTEPTPAF
ncbi:helix-turn-helix domain-containing protein [Streptomyces californicus]|uniref:helix-turn-helix domain-containing protein n=2 Tax=Streptomyces californicus TaxID=67351 RepID=UPI0012FEC6F5|nr:helix-turn-helix domain-containing protein [Streptomyces californicus]QRV59405.1 helix-turn-helix transcriptional regulator [Streptomyces californicus]